jgi:outer membrane protein assembly factor BamB
MTFFRSAVVLLLTLLLPGCSWWSSKSGPVPADLTSYKQTAKLEFRWDFDGPGDAKLAGIQPAVTREAVYVADARGYLWRLDRTSGNRAWAVSSEFAISGAVGAGEGLVLVGGDKGDLAAYSDEGKLLWKTRVSSEVLSSPQVADGMVGVRTGDGRITGLSAQDGKRQWLYERATPALIVRSHAGVVIQRGIVFAGFAAGKLAAINLKNGAVIWESTVSQPRGNTELERISDITSLPVVDDEQVCAISFQGRVACFDIAQGVMLWSRELSSDKGMTLLRQNLFITEANGTVLALDKKSGSSIWKNDQLFMRGVSAPFVLDNYVVVGDYKGYLHALNREDGGLAGRVALKIAGNPFEPEVVGRGVRSPVLFAPVALGDGLLVQTRAGDVYSIAIH